jgi:hypothetical protein
MQTIVDEIAEALESGKPIRRDKIAELVGYVRESNIAIPEIVKPSLDTQVAPAIDGGQNRLTVMNLITMAELFMAKINFDQVLDIYAIEAQTMLKKAIEQAKKLV